MKLRPEGRKLLVEADQTEEMSAGGIWIPKTAQEANQTRMTLGKVVAIGPAVDLVFEYSDKENPEKEGTLRHVQIGDRVWFSKYGGCRFETARDRDLRIINDEDVMAIIDG